MLPVQINDFIVGEIWFSGLGAITPFPRLIFNVFFEVWTYSQQNPCCSLQLNLCAEITGWACNDSNLKASISDCIQVLGCDF